MSKNQMQNIFDPEAFRKTGHELIDLLSDYLNDSNKGNQSKVINWVEPKDELKFWENYEIQNNDLTAFFKDVLDHSINVHHPKYMGHQVATPAPQAAFAGMVSDLLSNGMALFEMGMAASAIEQVVMDTFGKAIGYDSQSGGFLTSGGSLANFTAMLSARKVILDRDIWDVGYGDLKPAIMVSADAHYCIDRAGKIMGLGSKGVIKIPVNDKRQMDVNLLDEYYKKSIEEGYQVFAIIASSCSTSAGAYDDINTIADFAEQFKIWLHVDGAHGGGAIFSNQYKHLLAGIERADSITIDCHKMLMTPALATALVFKNDIHAYQTFAQQAPYLWRNDEELEWHNIGKKSFECTKLMMGMKFFIILKMYGINALDEYVTTTYDLAKNFANCVKERANFELLLEPEANIVCFRIVANSLEEMNRLNTAIRQQLLEEGEFYIVQTNLNGSIYLRVTLMNVFTGLEEINVLLNKVDHLGKSDPPDSCGI